MRKEITLKKEDFGSEWEGKYVFETMSWGTSNEITSDCTSINPATKKSSVDLKTLQARMLDATLVEKPKGITLDVLMQKDGIPMVLGEFLMSVADHVNGFGEEDRETLKKLKRRWGLE